MEDLINLLSRITSNVDICHGKPIIRGLRYTVQNMLELLASGMTRVLNPRHVCVAINNRRFRFCLSDFSRILNRPPQYKTQK